jgi:hypothetical protein
MRTKTRMKRWKIRKIVPPSFQPFHTQVSVLLNELGEQFGERRSVVADFTKDTMVSISRHS